MAYFVNQNLKKMKNFKNFFFPAAMLVSYLSCAQTWSPVGPGLGDANNDRANALVEYKGNLYAGGLFTLIQGPTSINVYLAKWNGSTWSSSGLMVNDRVNSLAVYKDTLYVAGDFTQIGIGTPVPANRLAKWDGSTLTPMPSNTAIVGPAHALGVYNGELYVAGSASGGSASNLCKWNGTTWTTLVSLDNRIQSIFTYSNALYIGGQFTTVGSLNANRIAKYDGANWTALGNGVNSGVYALAEFNGELVVGGSFTSAGSGLAASIARWNGNTWSVLGSGFSDWCLSLAAYHGRLYAGGVFTSTGLTSCNRIASWNGTYWSALGTGLNNNCFTMGVYNDSLYVSGTFTTAGGNPAKHVARWHESALDVGTSESVQQHNNFIVFPNPAHDELYIDQKDVKGALSLKLYDVAGRVVLALEHETGSPCRMNLSGIDAGVYFLEVVGKSSASKFKVIKQ
jgi:trimeric autotransporter adhesin